MDEVEVKKIKTINKIIALIFTYIFLLFCVSFVIFPLYWMINVSLTSVGGFNSASEPLFVSDNFLEGIKNYIDIFKNFSAARSIFNTLIFSVLSTVFAVIVVILAAYAFAKFEFKGKKITMFVFSVMAMLPSEVLIIGNYSTMLDLGLSSTFIALVFPSVLNMMYVYIMFRCFTSVNETLYLESRMDGLSDFNYLRKILIPMFRPTIVAITLLKFFECWNLYVWPSLISNDETYNLIGTAIQSMRINNVDVPLIMAFAVVVTVPAVIMLILFRKNFYDGIIKAVTREDH